MDLSAFIWKSIYWHLLGGAWSCPGLACAKFIANPPDSKHPPNPTITKNAQDKNFWPSLLSVNAEADKIKKLSVPWQPALPPPPPLQKICSVWVTQCPLLSPTANCLDLKRSAYTEYTSKPPKDCTWMRDDKLLRCIKLCGKGGYLRVPAKSLQGVWITGSALYSGSALYFAKHTSALSQTA